MLLLGEILFDACKMALASWFCMDMMLLTASVVHCVLFANVCALSNSMAMIKCMIDPCLSSINHAMNHAIVQGECLVIICALTPLRSTSDW